MARPLPLLALLGLLASALGLATATARAGRADEKHLVYRTSYAAALEESRVRNVPLFVSRHKDECGRCKRQYQKVLTDAKFVKWANEHLVVLIAHNEMLHDSVEVKGEDGEMVDRCPLYPGMTCRQHVGAAVDIDNARGEDLVQVPFLELCPNSWLVLPGDRVVRIEETDQFDPKRVRAQAEAEQEKLGKALVRKESLPLLDLLAQARRTYDDEQWSEVLAAYAEISTRVPEPSPSLRHLITGGMASLNEDVEIAADDFLEADAEDVDDELRAAARRLLAALEVKVYGEYLPVRERIATWIAAN